MNLVVGYFFLGLAGILVETAIAPALLPLRLTPELLLILVIYLGLYRQGFYGGLAAYTLGLLQDSFAGSCLGLYGLIFLVLYLTLRGLAERLHTGSPILMLFMVLCGTLFQAAMLIFLLGFLTDAGPVWRNILSSLPLQVLLNLICAWLLLSIPQLLRRHQSLRRSAKRL
ncbi:MAG: rod shape-determining protein MreD [Desulfuromonadaceae bacterium]|nr:rod shape-determining protein MreD [Desulfuromonadaceae bacterium]